MQENTPDMIIDQPAVTRFEVIDETGRAYTRLGITVALSFQDAGRTLKVFVNPKFQPLPEPADPVGVLENLVAPVGRYGLIMGEAWRTGDGAEIMDAYQSVCEAIAAIRAQQPAPQVKMCIQCGYFIPCKCHANDAAPSGEES